MFPLLVPIYFLWHYTVAIKNLLRVWRNFILFFYHFFSIGLLLSSLLAPWHGLLVHRGRGFDIGEFFRVAAENAISRGVGAWARSVVITIGLLAEFLTLAIGLTALIFWVLAPALIPAGFLLGIWIILFS